MTCQTPTLLLIEDFPADRDLYRRYLCADEDNTYRLLEAETVKAGLEFCRTEAIDAILLDYLLPDANGLQFLESLHAQSNGNSPPVVMVTDEGNERIAVQAIKLGAEDYLVKRCLTPEVLQLTVRSAIENARLRLQLRHQENQFRVSVENMLDCFGIFSAIRDQAGRILDFRIDYMNAAALEANRMTSMAISRGLCELLPNHRETGLFEEYCQLVETGRPLVKESLVYSDLYGQQQLTRAFDIRANKLGDGFVASWRDVTEQKQSQKALEQQARLLEMVDDAVIVRDRQSAIVTWNRAAEELYGWQRDEVMGNVTHQFLQTQFPIPEMNIDALLHQEGRWEGELIHTCKDGSQRIVESRHVLVRDEAGEEAGFLEVNRDITERKRMEALLQQSQERLQLALDSSQQGIWSFDFSTGKQSLCPQGRRFMGLEPGDTELTLEQVLAHVHPDDLERVYRAIDRSLVEEIYEVEFRVVTLDSTVRWVQERGKVLRNEQGQPLKAIGTSMDISDRKRTEAALRESDRRLREVFNTTYQFVGLLTPEGRVLEANQTALDFAGLTREDVIDRPFWEVRWWTISPQTQQQLQEAIRRARNGEFVRYEVEVLGVGETTAMIDFSLKPVRDESGQVVLLIPEGRDISDRLRYEENRQCMETALQEKENRFQSIVQAVPNLLFEADVEGRNIWSSESWCQFTGQTLQQAYGQGWVAAVHPEDLSKNLEQWERSLRQGIPFEVKQRLRRFDGIYCWALVRAVPVRNEQGQLHRWIGSITNVDEIVSAETEREQLIIAAEAARAEAQSANRSKDEFIAVVAHELRSPLNSILGWAKLLRTRQFNAETTAKALETIERNTLAQAQLVEDLLDVSRIASGKLSITTAPVNLMNVVEAAIDQVRLQAEAKQMKLNAHLTLPPLVSGDYNRLQQVVVNLLTNAIKFTPEQGQIDIELTQVETQVQLTVRDTGKGIAPEFLPYMFERFQQGQKNAGSKDGLGLGLAIVKNLVNLHEGTITVESQGVGLGATFTIRLPMLSTPAIAPERNLTPLHPMALAGVRILTVDDEPDMLNLIQFVLEECGAVVQTTASLKTATNLFPTFKPDILLSDIAMPEGTGYDLVQALRQYELSQETALLNAPIPAIALTAYASATYEERSLQAGFQKHLTKPVEPEVLVSTIAELVRRRQG